MLAGEWMAGFGEFDGVGGEYLVSKHLNLCWRRLAAINC